MPGKSRCEMDEIVLGLGMYPSPFFLKWCSFWALAYPKNAENWKTLNPLFAVVSRFNIKITEIKKANILRTKPPRLVACPLVTRLCPLRGKRKQKCWIASIGFVHCSHLRSKFSSDDTEKPRVTLMPCHLWALCTVPSRWREAFQSTQ